MYWGQGMIGTHFIKLIGLAAKKTWKAASSPRASATFMSLAGVIAIGTLLRAAFALPVPESVKVTSFSLAPKLGTQILDPTNLAHGPGPVTFVFVYPSCESCSLRRPGGESIRALADNPRLVIAVPDKEAEVDMARVVGRAFKAVALSPEDSQPICDVLGDAATLAQLDSAGRLVAYWGSRKGIEDESRRMQ
jgi:hypothetical protein